ncbi:hypothetical protein SP60_07240 [Candidatus Thioglobus autotrophicus]|jgi:hypothetical protein|uniref:Uncharacterized protein n=1 Tax=Candidatus Thioglobus autotrophicus TaxID=1705394 RepID=A0A0M5LF43_9GAMM|nr:hypothetical protein [Candidatus Thioglobus autotrophicus]ALE53003.1 hypothetical protein SP60_07240 [Candidatus Thioglobus autotrophicus]WPE17077.1 hypothetical protein R5P06_03180 [Candidatus Thioglobus autotrophicus]WPE18631.1 hypothetical protein R5P05_03225 [Candidatus Thioglobus autotrophicus]
MNKFIMAMVLTVVSVTAQANFESAWEKSVGWTIENTKTIDSFEHEDGRLESAFQGCEVGREINFSDDTYVTCTTQGYHYAYAPTAILLSKNGSYGKVWRMIVDGKMYGIK